MVDLSDSRYRLEHADKRIRELESELDAFIASNPLAQYEEISPDGTEEILKVKLVKPMPRAIPGVAFDIVSSLRSALDLAGYACAAARGATGKINAAFPFRDHGGEFDGARNGGSKDIPKEIFDVMISFNPYREGDGLIWFLNKLCNTDKHRIVTPYAVVASQMNISVFRVGAGGGAELDGRWDPAKNEMIVARKARGADVFARIQVQGTIAIANVEDTGYPPAEAVLKGQRRKVCEIIDAIDAEAKRIGL